MLHLYRYARVAVTMLVTLALAEPAPAADFCGVVGPGVDVRAKRKPSDADWVTYRTRTVAHIEGLDTVAVDTGLSRYGGLRSRRRKATGFFRVEKVDGRWWLVDPEGCLYVNVAVVALSPGNGKRSGVVLGAAD